MPFFCRHARIAAKRPAPAPGPWLAEVGPVAAADFALVELLDELPHAARARALTSSSSGRMVVDRRRGERMDMNLLFVCV
jgi:hypothetical protein